jgi:hypothetical protein
MVYHSEGRAVIRRKERKTNGILRGESGKVIEECNHYI